MDGSSEVGSRVLRQRVKTAAILQQERIMTWVSQVEEEIRRIPESTLSRVREESGHKLCREHWPGSLKAWVRVS